MAFVLDLRRLRYFQAIAAHGSLSAASRVLNVAQPALSHHISELEAGLGQAIFIRTQRGVELTPAGSVLLRHAEKILEDVVLAEAELRGLNARGAVPKAISFAMTPSLATITPGLFAAVQEAFPGLALHVSEIRSKQCVEMVVKGQVDMAIAFADTATADALPLVWENLFMVAMPSEADPDGTPVPFSDMVQEPLVLPSQGNGLRHIVEEAAASVGHRLNVTMEIDGLVFRKEAVLAGLGKTVLAFQNMARERRLGVLVARPIIDPPLRRLLMLQSREGLEPSVVAAFRQLLVPLLSSSWTTPA